MNKKVLIISSSPRKNGNSDVLCDEFAKGATNGNNEVEKIFLGDYKINYCSGCGFCTSNKGKCSQKDDMTILKEKIINSDVIVLATPIYFYTMCGQLKTFIDRHCFFYTEIISKDFYYIMTAADNEKAMDNTIQEFKGFLDCLHSPQLKGIIKAGNVWKIGDVNGKKYINQAFEMGKNI